MTARGRFAAAGRRLGEAARLGHWDVGGSTMRSGGNMAKINVALQHILRYILAMLLRN